MRERVAAWDAALAAVRTCMRDAGMCEAPTPVVVDELALEPWIEPVCVGQGFLQTSPELVMKRLLARGSGPIFQIAAVARAGERGDWHRESFALLEWYRDAPDTIAVRRDVERVIAAVVDALAPWRSPSAIAAPVRWREFAFLDVLAEHGVTLRGDEDADTLMHECSGIFGLPVARCRDPFASTLEAWTILFTLWCDDGLDRWLAERGEAGEGVHLVDFPAPLAALAERSIDAQGRAVSRRFESHAFGRELANGYGELRDADEQRKRFTAVADLRAAYGLPARALPERFLADLPALPPCAGCALGLDRLVALALGATSLADVALDP